MFSRNEKTKIKSRKKRTISSRRWLERQLNDPFVQQARQDGYRSRAAYKLLEIQEKYALLRQGQYLIDLGAAPGGWSQVSCQFLGKDRVIGVDLLSIPSIEGVMFLQRDFTKEETVQELLTLLQGKLVDHVLSDMAPATSGFRDVDHIRLVDLIEKAFDFAQVVLKPGGSFISKVFQGGAQGDLLLKLKQQFEKVHHFKPKSSRSESPEIYLVARGFKGRN